MDDKIRRTEGDLLGLHEADRFDLTTEAVIREHRRIAAMRAPGQLVPLNQDLTTTFPHFSARVAVAGEVVEGEVVAPLCEVCDGAGYYKEAVPLGHPNFGQLFPCVCKLDERAERRARAAAEILARLTDGLGFLAHKRLEDIDPDRPFDPEVSWCGVTADEAQQRESLVRALADARRYLADPVGGVFLCGPTGAGKTLLAAAILNELVLAEAVAASYESAPKLLRFIQAGFKDHSADARLDALLSVDLLLIDDLGTESKSGWNEQTLFELIDTRYTHGRRTIVTANIRRKDLSPRLASRIADMISAEIWLVVSDLREIRLRERRKQQERGV